MNKKKLTLQQARFVEAMAHPQTKSQTQAAIKAGCPPKTARITASKWLTKSNISEAIRERRREVVEHARVTPEEVIGFAAFQMHSSIDDVLDDNGSFSLEKARATGAIDIAKRLKVATTTNKKGDTTRVVEIELLSSADAREELANYMVLNKYDQSRKKAKD